MQLFHPHSQKMISLGMEFKSLSQDTDDIIQLFSGVHGYYWKASNQPNDHAFKCDLFFFWLLKNSSITFLP